MNNWWLKVYTWPNLKDTAMMYAFVLVGILGVYFIKPEYDFLAAMSVALLFMVQSFPQKNSFIAHVKFHKLSISPKELRRFYLCDFAIRSTFRIVCLTAAFSLMYFLFAKEFRGADFIGLPSSMIRSLLIAYLGLFFFEFCAGFTMTLKSSPAKVMKGMPKLKYFLKVSVTFLFVGLFYYFSHKLMKNVMGEFPSHLLVLSIMSVAVFSIDQILFNKKIINDSSIMKKYFSEGKSLAFILPTAFTLGLMTYPLYRLELKSPWFSDLQKMDSMVFWGDLSPGLDHKTFLSHIRNAHKEAQYQIIFAKAPKASLQISSTEMFVNLTARQLAYYVKYLNPSHEEFSVIARTIKLENFADDESTKVLARFLIKKWPKDQALPKILADYKVRTEEKSRAVASETKSK